MATPNCCGSMDPAAICAWAAAMTMRQERLLTRWPGCWAWPIRAVRRSRPLAGRAIPAALPCPRAGCLARRGATTPYDFSFSGLKTAMLRQVRALEQARPTEPLPLADLAASFEQVVAEVLVERSCRCAREQGLETLVLVGGVAANRRLRALLEQRCRRDGLAWRVAPLAYCTDNAAMIGLAAAQRLAAGQTSSLELGVGARMPLEQADRLYEQPGCF